MEFEWSLVALSTGGKGKGGRERKREIGRGKTHSYLSPSQWQSAAMLLPLLLEKDPTMASHHVCTEGVPAMKHTWFTGQHWCWRRPIWPRHYKTMQVSVDEGEE